MQFSKFNQLEKHAFKAIIGEALEAGRQKAAEFSRDRQLP
jgi:hypothetical protein